jgi:hypothetical protein
MAVILSATKDAPAKPMPEGHTGRLGFATLEMESASRHTKCFARGFFPAVRMTEWDVC